MLKGSEIAPATPRDEGRWLRDILGRFATGVVAVTAVEPASGEPVGLVMNSFTSVSLTPPLVAMCVAHTSSSWPRVRSASALCLNILSDRQGELSARFASSGRDKFRGVRWTCSPAGAPIIDGCLAWLECEVVTEHATGDHMLVVARVLRADHNGAGNPLVFYHSRYVTVSGGMP
ncbi:MAG: flavin reductase family protein [Actinophytocola sp.]|uniref:flavin reductase family protein n=1 Tax=Actinophytocola sp. TaxID=1872138 RepID=UPI003C7182F6